MPIFNEETVTQLKDLLGDLPEKVHIVYFTGEKNCRTCKDTKQYITEFADLHENLSLEVFDYDKDKDQVEKYGIERIPAIVILDKDKTDRGVRFYGIPAGYEIHSLIASVKEAAGKKDEITKEQEERIKNIDKDIHIRVFVTPTCPYCPAAVINGHKLAFKSEKVTCDMVESTSFPDLAQKYAVRGVPKIVINETYELTGSQPVEKFLEIIESIK